MALATFAGGCFWCTESAFLETEGVLSVVPGYAGGEEADASYDTVSSGRTEHLEAAQVSYDPARVSYEHLLDVFWRHIDPIDNGGQFADRGPQYRTAIFVHDDEQRSAAERSKKEQADLWSAPIATEIRGFTTFFAAEPEHHAFSEKNPAFYKQYYEGSGRGPFVRGR